MVFPNDTLGSEVRVSESTRTPRIHGKTKTGCTVQLARAVHNFCKVVQPNRERNLIHPLELGQRKPKRSPCHVQRFPMRHTPLHHFASHVQPDVGLVLAWVGPQNGYPPKSTPVLSARLFCLEPIFLVGLKEKPKKAQPLLAILVGPPKHWRATGVDQKVR